MVFQRGLLPDHRPPAMARAAAKATERGRALAGQQDSGLGRAYTEARAGTGTEAKEGKHSSHGEKGTPAY